jgi:hypothetical protein
MNMKRVAQAKSSRNDHQPRALLDVCAYIDADLLSQQSILDIPLSALLDVDICLCLSALPLYLETNVKVSTLIDLLGLTDVSALLQAVVSLIIPLLELNQLRFEHIDHIITFFRRMRVSSTRQAPLHSAGRVWFRLSIPLCSRW